MCRNNNDNNFCVSLAGTTAPLSVPNISCVFGERCPGICLIIFVIDSVKQQSASPTHKITTVQPRGEELFIFIIILHTGSITSTNELKEATNMAEIQPTKSPKSLYKLALKTYTCNLNNNVTTLDKYGILRGLPPTVLADIYTRVSRTFYVVTFRSATNKF